jgi:hypothetical protein
MDAASLRDSVEAEKRTQLDRLGSSKYLIALTDADLTEDVVLEAVAVSEYLARETFETYRDVEEHDVAREAFAAVAEQEAEHYDRVCERLGSRPEPDHAGAVHGYLRERDDTVARLGGGLLGRPLVSTRTHTQVVSFFVNEADRAGADLFRELKRETSEELDCGVDALDAVCETDDDFERARGTAEYTIQLAYDEYADSLEELGVNPKSVC